MRNEDIQIGNYPRTDRFFQKASGWFFTIRQGAAFGPYESHQHAQKHLQSFISLVRK